MKKNSTVKVKKVEGFYIPDRKKKVSYKDKNGNKRFHYEERYKNDETFLRQAWKYNQHLFTNFNEFKRTVGEKLTTASKTTTTGRFNLRVPKGKMPKEEYLEQVFSMNKEKIMNAYSSFSNRIANEETVFKRFKQEYNLREEYIYDRTKRKSANRSEILNALQRSDFFNTTEQRQRYSLLEEMKLIKTGGERIIENGKERKRKKSNMLKDFMRDLGFSNVDQLVDEQHLKHYYEYIKEERVTIYFFQGRDGSIWKVIVENSPVSISYFKIGDSTI